MIHKLGGTVDDTELVEGLVLDQRSAGGGPTRVEKAKIGLIQFCISPPKTDVCFFYYSLFFIKIYLSRLLIYRWIIKLLCPTTTLWIVCCAKNGPIFLMLPSKSRKLVATSYWFRSPF